MNGFKETEIGLIPEDWNVTSPNEIVDVKGGKRLPRGEKFLDAETEYPYLRVTDFKNFSIHHSKFIKSLTLVFPIHNS